jgi:hypothetical protein
MCSMVAQTSRLFRLTQPTTLPTFTHTYKHTQAFCSEFGSGFTQVTSDRWDMYAAGGVMPVPDVVCWLLESAGFPELISPALGAGVGVRLRAVLRCVVWWRNVADAVLLPLAHCCCCSCCSCCALHPPDISRSAHIMFNVGYPWLALQVVLYDVVDELNERINVSRSTARSVVITGQGLQASKQAAPQCSRAGPS